MQEKNWMIFVFHLDLRSDVNNTKHQVNYYEMVSDWLISGTNSWENSITWVKIS